MHYSAGASLRALCRLRLLNCLKNAVLHNALDDCLISVILGACQVNYSVGQSCRLLGKQRVFSNRTAKNYLFFGRQNCYYDSTS